MPGHWESEGALFELLIRTNLPGLTNMPNRTLVRPGGGSSADPVLVRRFDVDYESVKTPTVGRLRDIDGFLFFQLFQTANSGDGLIRADMYRMDSMADAVTLASAGRLAMYGVVPGPFSRPDETDTAWYEREARVPFKRLYTPSAEQASTLAGLASDSITITTPVPHGLAVKDCVGFDPGAAAKWVKVTAGGSIGFRGMVTLVENSTTFILTTQGAVRVPAHGLPLGELYLSETVPGLAIVSPEVISLPVATAYDADNLIILSYPASEVTL